MGKNGTPDLRDRIPVGTGKNIKAGKQGGQLKYVKYNKHKHTFKLTNNELPSHNHSISFKVTDKGRHWHKVTTDNGNLNITGTFATVTKIIQQIYSKVIMMDLEMDIVGINGIILIALRLEIRQFFIKMMLL